jgi:hypothetical protein
MHITDLFTNLIRRKKIKMMRKSEVQSKDSFALLQSLVNTNIWTGETRTERKHPGDFHNQSNQRGIQ